jgi:V8-like Glu-specific endopeptidase
VIARNTLGKWLAAAGAAAGWVAGCGSAPHATEAAGKVASPIQDGTPDTTHNFVVGIVQLGTSAVEFCTGALLAPNLVATARHCVAQLSSSIIDCSSSTFGSLVDPKTLYVTNEPVIRMNSAFVPVAPGGIIVPSASNEIAVCGNDIALLILSQNISIPEYVVPVISPPMTNKTYTTNVTAIGYGINTPTDDAGVTAGTRRIKQNVALACIPNDPNFNDCFSDPTAKQYLSANEFVSGDSSTCEGDSGSSAFEQSNFDQGKWVSFGVLSRGGVSADGQTCIGPIYTRFDAWGSLLTQAVTTASAMGGGYSLPTWAGGPGLSGFDAGSSSSSSSGGIVGGTTSGSSGSTHNQDGSGCPLAGTGADGVSCCEDADCVSGHCLGTSASNLMCVRPCDANGQCPMASQTCQGNDTDGHYCFPSMPSSHPKGCSSAGSAGSSVAPWGTAPVFGIGLLAVARRRQRRVGVRARSV